MTQDHTARTELGAQLQSKLLNKDTVPPRTFCQSTWRDYIFAEIWSRPGLDHASRYLISIAGACSSGSGSELLDDYVRGALANGALMVSELREVAVHCFIYNGIGSGEAVDAAVDRAIESLGLEEAELTLLRDAPWEPQERLQRGAEEFHKVMTFPGPPPVAPYFENGILNFVFGEVWHREALSQRRRRWLTLVGVCDSAAENPIRTHIYGAMASGNCTFEEMQEFVLQYAVHAGWPKASFAQGILFDMANKIRNNLTWDGQPKDQ